MSFEETTCSYEINIKFTEVTIEQVEEEKIEDVKLELIFINQKILTSTDSQLAFSNGVHDVDLQFNLNKSGSELANEEFNFHALGDPLKVNLVKYFPDTKKSAKKSKDVKLQSLEIASGLINLLDVLQHFQETGMDIFIVNLDPLDGKSFEISLQYQISFSNVPTVNLTLALEVSQILNFEVEPEEIPEIAFHFPADSSCYRKVLMQRVPATEGITAGFLIHKCLKDSEVSVNLNQSKAKFSYKNILSPSGFDNLGEIILQHGVLLLEIKTKKNIFMAFVQLQIFNYEGVKEASFLEPIYYRSKKVIIEKFHQDLDAFPVEESSGKKKSNKKLLKEEHIENEDELIQLVNEEKCAAIMIKLTVSHYQVPECRLEDLKLSLNRSFPFIAITSFKDQVIAQSDKDFAQVVSDAAEKMEKFIDKNSDLESNELELKIRKAMEKGELFDKIQLKEAMKDVIGNKLNVGLLTETNHEFKISMIQAFKSLNQEMMCVLYSREEGEMLRPPKQLSLELLTRQAEEWMMMGRLENAEEIYQNGLKSESNTELLANYSIFLLKNGKFQDCSNVVNQLLKVDTNFLFSFYILAYLMTEADNFDVAILCMKILIKLQPDNLEFWILLSMLYMKSEDKLGVDYCSLNLVSKMFVGNSINGNKPLLIPDWNSEDDFANVLIHQLKHGLVHFVQMTKGFMSLTSKNLREPYDNFHFRAFEMTIAGMAQEMGELLESVELNDQNEMAFRIFKGNWLYDSETCSAAIDEYEVGFNLCLKVNVTFPNLPTVRCGDWFMKAGILNKARRYFHYACKRSPTFNTWMGLGAVCFQGASYLEAEKYFNEANKIDNKSGDNWIYLALCNFNLRRQESFDKCIQVAKNLEVNSSLTEIVEGILDL